MADYAAKPTKAKEDTAIIELRKRMLAVFLNRCRRMKEVREDGVWWRFLDPNVSWVRRVQATAGTATNTNFCVERGSPLASRIFGTKKQLKSASPRPRESHACARLAASAIFFREAERNFRAYSVRCASTC
jgi:hypothetical protein